MATTGSTKSPFLIFYGENPKIIDCIRHKKGKYQDINEEQDVQGHIGWVWRYSNNRYVKKLQS